MTIINNLFGPLQSANYCYFYYIMSIFSFITIIIWTFVSIYKLYSTFTSEKKNKTIFSSLYSSISLYIIGVLPIFITYIISRLFYTLCLKNIK